MNAAESPATYLDVRTVEEFEEAHPSGAYNVPVFFREAGQPVPNASFVAEVERVLPKDKRLGIGCMSGMRSQKACDFLADAGYKSLANVEGGFGGARGPAGEVTARGWMQEGLPTERGNPSGRAYAGKS